MLAPFEQTAVLCKMTYLPPFAVHGTYRISNEELETSVKLAVDVIGKLGHRSYTATRQGQRFLKYDEDTIVQMAEHRHDMKQYVIIARETFRFQEELLSKDLELGNEAGDHSWDSDSIKEVLGRNN